MLSRIDSDALHSMPDFVQSFTDIGAKSVNRTASTAVLRGCRLLPPTRSQHSRGRLPSRAMFFLELCDNVAALLGVFRKNLRALLAELLRLVLPCGLVLHLR